MKKVFSILSLFLIIIGCSTKSTGTDTGNVIPSPTPVASGTEYCPAAQSHLQNLCAANPKINAYCCQVVAPTKKNKEFKDFCADTQNNGISLDPECLSKIVKCEEIDKCTHTVRSVPQLQAVPGCESGTCAYPKK